VDPVSNEDVLAGINLAKERDEELLYATMPDPETISETVTEAFGGPLPDSDLVVFVMGMYAGVLAERNRVEREPVTA
jgi:hypothetical protein